MDHDRNDIPLVRSPSNFEGRAGFKPWAFVGIDTDCVDGFGFLDGGICGWGDASQEIRISSFRCVSASFACNSARACSRAVSLSLSIGCEVSLSGGTVSGDAEEGSRAEEYTESVESETELRKTTMVNWLSTGISPLRDPFLMLGQLRLRLSRDLAGDPK